MKSLVLVLLVPFVFGCASTGLNKQGEKVKLKSSNPPSNCQEVDTLIEHQQGLTHSGVVDSLKNTLRNKAAEKGANYVRLDSTSTSNGVTMTGTAFKCPE